MNIIVNPGTQASATATEANAAKVAERICAELSATCSRHPEHDRDGWFRFLFVRDGRSVEVDVPGDDPDVVCQGRPWVSRRLYVEGSSWLYGYAMGFIARALGCEEEE